MDPNEALKKLRDALFDYNDAEGTDVFEALERVAAYADALDCWLTGGGFLPKDWTR